MSKKKLMILGGSLYIIPVIEKAHELDIYVITVDYLPGNDAHKYSDEYHNVSVVDKEAVLELAKELEIDGITSFVNDVGVVTAAYVAEKMGLNFQCPYDSAVILQDKGKFREFLEQNGFNCPKSKKYNDSEVALKDIDHFTWPVIVKPTDSCGSRGVTKVDRREDLKSAMVFAIENSRNGCFIIEEFIQFKGYHSSADSFTINGKLVFNVYSDHMFDKSLNRYAETQIVWPTTMGKSYQDYLTKELQRLMSLLKMKHGIYNIETCVGNDNKPYIMEVSPRGGGLRIAEIQKLAYGIDLIENEVRQAVGMPMIPIVSKEPDGVWCELVLYYYGKQPLRFTGYSVDERIKKKYVKLIDIQKKYGDLLEPFSGGNTSFGNVFLHCETRDALDDLVENFSDWFKIRTE
jgi:biotin carboxylase